MLVLTLLLGVLAVGCWVAGPSLLPASPQVISRALVTADGRHVIVPADIQPGCSQAELSADEGPRQVVLSLSEKTTGVLPCADVAALETATAVLGRPLSGRVLIDAATGRPVRYFDGRNLYRVSYVPAGYRLSADTRLAFSSPFGRAVNSWTRAYMGPGPQDWLTVVQALPSSQALVTYPLTQHTVVNGHQAAIGEDTENGRVDGRAITWSAGGYSLAVVSSPGNTTVAPLPISELILIARGLHG